MTVNPNVARALFVKSSRTCRLLAQLVKDINWFSLRFRENVIVAIAGAPYSWGIPKMGEILGPKP